jgi:hypothetical protein
MSQHYLGPPPPPRPRPTKRKQAKKPLTVESGNTLLAEGALELVRLAVRALARLIRPVSAVLSIKHVTASAVVDPNPAF